MVKANNAPINLTNQRGGNKQQSPMPMKTMQRLGSNQRIGANEINKDIKLALESTNQQYVNVGSGVVELTQDDIGKQNFRKNSQPQFERQTMNQGVPLNNYASQEQVQVQQHDGKQTMQAREQNKY